MSGLPPPPPPGGYKNGYQQPGAPRYQTQSYPQVQTALPPPPRPGAQSDPMQMPPPPARANLISANYSNQAMITQGQNMYGSNFANASGVLAPPASQPPGAGGMLPPPPPSSGPKIVDERDKILFEMQKLIFHFYCAVDQSKVDKSVFALALQLWWDEGLDQLNQILKAKYGKTIQSDDILDDFDRDGNDITIMPVADVNASAGHQHMLFKTMLRTNNADYFNADKEKNEENFRISFNKRRTAMGSERKDSWPMMEQNLRPPQFTTSVNLTNQSPIRAQPMVTPPMGNQMPMGPPGMSVKMNPVMLASQQSQFNQSELTAETNASKKGKKNRNETEKERRRRKRKEKERREKERRRKDRKKHRKRYESDSYDSESE